MLSNIFSTSQSVGSAYPTMKETIPLSERGYHTNNKYNNIPPFMNDGRSITNTNQQQSVMNAKLAEDNKITSNWQYREYLTKNADTIMRDNYFNSANDVGYHSRAIDVPSIQSNIIKHTTRSPGMFSSILDNEKPLGFTGGDLKDNYLSREQLYARKVSPVITQEKLYFNKRTTDLNNNNLNDKKKVRFDA